MVKLSKTRKTRKLKKSKVLKRKSVSQKGGVINLNNDEPNDLNPFQCPITLELMIDPVVASDGNTYERQAIQNVLNRTRISPISREELLPTLYPCRSLKTITDMIAENNVDFRNQYEEARNALNLTPPVQVPQNQNQNSFTNETLRTAVRAYINNATRDETIQRYGEIGTWNVSNVNDMYRMFYQFRYFNEPLNSWNVSNVTNMEKMFKFANSFNQPLNSWNVSNVTNMNNMFGDANLFNQELNSWNVSNMSNMGGMFLDAQSFNQPLNSWDVSNVTNMEIMFYYARSFNQPLNSWNVSNVQNMVMMFYNAESFNEPLNSWNVSKATNMDRMFSYAGSFNQELDDWNVSNVQDMSDMFRDSGMSSNTPSWYRR